MQILSWTPPPYHYLKVNFLTPIPNPNPKLNIVSKLFFSQRECPITLVGWARWAIGHPKFGWLDATIQLTTSTNS